MEIKKFENYEKMVLKIINKEVKIKKWGDVDDLFSESYFAYVKAVETYDEAKGYKFTTHLYHKVKSHIADHIRKEKLTDYREKHKLQKNFDFVHQSNIYTNKLFVGKAMQTTNRLFERVSLRMQFSRAAKNLGPLETEVLRIIFHPQKCELLNPPKKMTKHYISSQLKNLGYNTTQIKRAFQNITLQFGLI